MLKKQGWPQSPPNRFAMGASFAMRYSDNLLCVRTDSKFTISLKFVVLQLRVAVVTTF